LKLEEMTRKAVAEIAGDEWKEICSHVKKTQKSYCVKNAALETETKIS
jgi:hypothetical protein